MDLNLQKEIELIANYYQSESVLASGMAHMATYMLELKKEINDLKASIDLERSRNRPLKGA